MRGSIRISLLLGCACALGGCARSVSNDTLAATPPMHDELPRYRTVTPRVSPRVSAEGDFSRPREVLVPDFAPPPMTPEEAEVWAELNPEQEPYYFLKFFPPQRGPEHGVSSLPGDLEVGIGLPRTALAGVMVVAPDHPFEYLETGGTFVGIGVAAERVAGASLLPRISAGAASTLTGRVLVGECPAPTKAERAAVIDH